MDLIYKRALATIVAVSGTNADSGLPGLSLGRRIRPSIETNAGTLVAAPKNLSSYLAKSKWATRGWTYQESILARRCLFFTHDQVFSLVGCTGGPIPFRSLKAFMVKILGRVTNLNDNHLTVKWNGGGEVLEDLLHAYTSRLLSRETNGLNAFRGILSRFAGITYWGISLQVGYEGSSKEHITRQFIRDLFWKIAGCGRDQTTITRRPMFPTWSWASLNAKIDIASASSLRRSEERPVTILIEDADRDLCSLDEVYRIAEMRGLAIEEVSPYLHITGLMCKASLKKGHTLTFGTLPFSATFDGLDKPIATSKVYIDIFTDTSFMTLLSSQKWDVFAPVGTQYWLILDWRDEVAVRIGWMAMDLFEWEQRSLELEGEIKTIKLG